MNNQPGNAPMDSETLARVRYAAYAQRRTMPPRCNPVGILFLVLTLGILFIGLTMTIIANWPGATTIGENPLRIAGPVLLGVGGAMFILTIIAIFFLNHKEQILWERKLTNLAADRINSSSREILVVRNNDQPPLNDNPYKIRTSSSQEVTSSRGSGAYPIKDRYTVDMLPDPVGNSKQPGKFHDVSLDSVDKVPDPMRVQKKRPTSRRSGSSNPSVNNSYSSGAGEADLGVPGFLIPAGHRLTQQVTNNSHGGYMNASFESADREVRGARNGTGQQKSRGDDDGGRRADMGRGRGHVPGLSSQMRGDLGRGGADPQQLRVHIKAQPGTAIHITPTATPPLSRHSRQMAGRTSLDTSGETEI